MLCHLSTCVQKGHVLKPMAVAADVKLAKKLDLVIGFIIPLERGTGRLYEGQSAKPFGQRRPECVLHGMPRQLLVLA